MTIFYPKRTCPTVDLNPVIVTTNGDGSPLWTIFATFYPHVG